MKNKFVSTLAMLLLLSTVGCGETSTPVSEASPSGHTTASETSETEESDILDVLPANIDFGGAPFRIICTEDFVNYDRGYIFAEAENGEILNDTALRCYTAVEDRCNTDIQIIPVTNQEIYSSIHPAVMAGEDAYDYIQFFGTRDQIASVIHQQMLYDLETISTLNLSEPCFFDGFSRNFSINGKTYVGFSAYVNAGSLPLYMVFNKKMMQMLDLEYPYQTIKDGKWTYDCFLSYLKNTAADLDGDGKMTWNDRYGYGNVSTLTNYMVFGFDVDSMKKTADGTYEPDLMNEKLVSAIERILELRDNPNCTPQDFNVKNGDGVHYFMSGNALFSTTGTGSLVLRNISDFDFGIAPYPKYDEAQKDYVVSLYPDPFGIPVTAQNTERLGTVIHAMALAFNDAMEPVFLNKYTEQKILRDEESVEIARMLMHGKVNIDIMRIYNFDDTLSLPSLLETIKSKDTVISTIAKIESSSLKKAQKFFDGFLN